MFIGRVVGSVWSSVKWPQLEGLKLLSVQPYHLSDLLAPGDEDGVCHDMVVCADILDAGEGDDVVVAYGHAARVALQEALGPAEKPIFPVDAAVVAIVDRTQLDREALTELCDGREKIE